MDWRHVTKSESVSFRALIGQRERLLVTCPYINKLYPIPVHTFIETTDMVLVVIKAANGAVPDFDVNGATPSWTAAQLKNYLYRHYPTHPVSCSVPLVSLMLHGTSIRTM